MSTLDVHSSTRVDATSDSRRPDSVRSRCQISAPSSAFGMRWRSLKYAIALLAASAAVGVALPSVASATDYPVTMDMACMEQYSWTGVPHFAAYYNYNDAFSWYCLPGYGGIDVQEYCQYHYSGNAVVVVWNVYGWRCRT